MENTQADIGRFGELHATLKLMLGGWHVNNLNGDATNMPNSDLLAYRNDGKSLFISVKATNNIDEVRLTNTGIEGAQIFNMKKGGPPANFVMFITGANSLSPRFFTLPIDSAECLFKRVRDVGYERKKSRGSSIRYPYFLIHTRQPKRRKRKHQSDENFTIELLKFEGLGPLKEG